MKLLVLGAESQLGTALTRVLQEQGVEHAVLATDELDLLKQMDLLKKVARCSPTQVIHVTSSINLTQAENDPDAASKLDITNTTGLSTLAEVCKHLNLPLLLIATGIAALGIAWHGWVAGARPQSPRSAAVAA